MSQKRRTAGERLAQARRLKAVREWQDVSRADIAKAVGVDASSVTVWEKTSRLPNDERLADVAQFLGVSPAWIRYGLDSEAPRAGLLAAIIDPATARRLTEEELDRAEAQVAKERGTGKRPPRGKANGA